MSAIPDDIMEISRATLDKLLCHCSESCGGYDGMREAAATDIAMAILAEREVSHKRGLRDGIDEALQIAVEQAGVMADLALEGVEENARVREAMEAALTRFSQKLAVTLADLSHSPKPLSIPTQEAE